MPAIQDTYTARQAIGFEGMKVSGETYNAITRLAEDAGGINFGKPVSRGVADAGCLAFTAANSAAFLGISVLDVSVRPSAGDKYPLGGNVTILTKGAIFVKVAGVVAPGNPVRYDTVAGRFTTAAASGTVIALPGWVFDMSAIDQGIASIVNR